MTRPTRLLTTTTTIITALLASSCIPSPVICTPTSEELSWVLSEVLLRPEVSCERLRKVFGVEYLTLVPTPEGAGLAYEEHLVPIEGETLLRVWYLPTALDRGLVVLSQGAAGTMPCYLFHARMLARNGWSVVMYEYRGFGESNGELDFTELRADLETVVDWACAYTKRQQVTLMGISLGSVPSVAVAVERPDAVNGVVLDSPLALGEAIRRLEFVLDDQTQEFIDRLVPELVSENLIVDMHQPLLVFSSELDLITTPESIQLLYERAPGPKRLVSFAGLGHAGAPFRDTGAYTYYLEAFLSSVWLQQAPLNLETRVPQAPTPDASPRQTP